MGTPSKSNMEPEDYWVVEENCLPKLHLQVCGVVMGSASHSCGGWNTCWPLPVTMQTCGYVFIPHELPCFQV